MTEKPLHVQVAEALGWTGCNQSGFDWWGDSQDTPSSPRGYAKIPSYDTDWSATGPLIEKYGIAFVQNFDESWRAANGWVNGVGVYPSPLLAVLPPPPSPQSRR